MLQSQKNKKNILVLAAHPDDETLGCGATLSRLSKEGHNIELITLTDGVGSRQKNENNRNSKLEEVSKILGIKKFSSGNFPDNAMDSIPLLEICKFLESKTNFTPDVVFTHFLDDLNIDHQLTTKAALTVFRPQVGDKMKLYSFYIPSSTDYNPTAFFNGNTYFDISKDDLDNKIKALEVYKEEMRDYPHSRSFLNIENLMRVWGSEVGLLYCEKFKLLREVV